MLDRVRRQLGMCGVDEYYDPVVGVCGMCVDICKPIERPTQSCIIQCARFYQNIMQRGGPGHATSPATTTTVPHPDAPNYVSTDIILMIVAIAVTLAIAVTVTLFIVLCCRRFWRKESSNKKDEESLVVKTQLNGDTSRTTNGKSSSVPLLVHVSPDVLPEHSTTSPGRNVTSIDEHQDTTDSSMCQMHENVEPKTT